MRHHVLCFVLILTASMAAVAGETVASATSSQASPDALASSDPSAFLGLTPREAFAAFGAPLRLQTVRGPETWQDDVVFCYDTMDLYWFKDHIWQIGLKSAYGIRLGDSQDQVRSVLGEPLNRLESAFIYQRTGRSWPLRLRVGFDASLKVSDLYLYRADY